MSRAVTDHRECLHTALGSLKLVFDEARFEPPGEGPHDWPGSLDLDTGLPLTLVPVVDDLFPRYAKQVERELRDLTLTTITGRYARMMKEAQRLRIVRFFIVSNLRIPKGWGQRKYPVSVRVPTLAHYFWEWAFCLKNASVEAVDALVRKLEVAKEAARDRNRSAIERGIALAHVDALVALISSFAVEALGVIRPVPLPQVLAAGGQSALFVPRP